MPANWNDCDWRERCACGKKISKDQICCKKCEELQI